MCFTPFKVILTLGDPLKATGSTSPVLQITFKAYAPERRLCVHTTHVSYLKKTLDTRGNVTSLLLTATVTQRAASKNTLIR